MMYEGYRLAGKTAFDRELTAKLNPNAVKSVKQFVEENKEKFSL